MDRILKFVKYACGCVYDAGIKECACPKHYKGIVKIFEERIPEPTYPIEEKKDGYNFYNPENVEIESDHRNMTIKLKWISVNGDKNCLVVHKWDMLYPREQIVFKYSIEIQQQGYNFYFPNMVKVTSNHLNNIIIFEWISKNKDVNHLMVRR